MKAILKKLKGRKPADFLSPAMWRKAARNALDQWNFAREEKAIYNAADGVARHPRMMVFDVTIRCNLRCKMCYLREDIRSSKAAGELDIDQIKSIIGGLGIRDVNLVGGEPLVRRDLADILDFFRSAGIRCPTLTTNGTLLNPERARELVPFLADGTLNSMTFSIDGPEDIHDEVRGKGMCRRTLAGMRNVLDAAKELGLPLPRAFNVNITASDVNFRRFDEVPDMLHGLNVGYIEVNHLIWHTRHEINASMKMLDETEQDYFQSGVDHVPAIDPAALIDTLHRLGERAAAHGIKTGTRAGVPEDQIPLAYSDRYRPHARCLSPYHLLRVQSDGLVYFCHNIRTIMGDLKTQSLDEIWNGDKFRRYRATLLEHGIVPVCRRCCRVDLLD